MEYSMDRGAWRTVHGVMKSQTGLSHKHTLLSGCAVVLICVSLITSNIKQLSCEWWPFVYLLWRNVYSNTFSLLTI